MSSEDEGQRRLQDVFMTSSSRRTSAGTISELYQNLTFETLSGARQIQFEWMPDLVLHITYKIATFYFIKN